MNILEFLKPMPVVGILRDIPEGSESDCIQTASLCGLKAIEVTMNTKNAKSIIRNLKVLAKPYEIIIGAGTVRHGSELENAMAAGAEFIVTPNTRNDIIRMSSTAGIPIIPGALTPTEIQKAFDLGAVAVKVFPVNCVGGPNYIKELRGPFRDIPLMACGGVNAQNAHDYIESGSNLLAFGGSIFNAELMINKNWNEIKNRLQLLTDSIKKAISV